MKKIDLNQRFSVFLNSILMESHKRNAAFTKTCDILYSLANSKEDNSFRGLTLKEALEVDSDIVFKFRGIGPLGYVQLCKIFVGSNVEMSDKPFFRQYFILERELNKQNPKLPKVTIKPIKVRTDPETTVFQITVAVDGVGIWPVTANTPSEASFFLKGLQVMNSFSGLPMLELPPIPKPE